MSRQTKILVHCKDNKYRKLLNITYNNDGSIYFIFRKETQFKLKKRKEVNFSKKDGKKIIKLDEIVGTFTNPKISFHPGKKVVHLMTESRDDIDTDHLLYNSILDSDLEAYYLLQIIFPSNLMVLDEYKKKINKDCYVITHDMFNNQESICVEIIVHSCEIEPVGEKNLPPSNNRRLVAYTMYEGLDKYTCSIFVSGFMSEDETNYLLFTLNTKKSYCAYLLEPINEEE